MSIETFNIFLFWVLFFIALYFGLVWMDKKNKKRANKLTLEKDDEVVVSTDHSMNGKVIEDKGETVRIEIEVSRHLLHKK